MKCQKCNKNEANVQYREMINGTTREIHLCSECAKETGLLKQTSDMFARMERSMMNAFAFPFGGSRLLGGSFFDEPFAEIGGFFENDPVESMSLPSYDAPEKEKKENKREKKQPEAETVDTLKAKLLDAIADERYEDAAKYRDKIKQLKGE